MLWGKSMETILLTCYQSERVLCTNNMSLLASSSNQALLSAPNPDDPLSENIAKHWKSNEAEAVETGMLFLVILI